MQSAQSDPQGRGEAACLGREPGSRGAAPRRDRQAGALDFFGALRGEAWVEPEAPSLQSPAGAADARVHTAI